MWELQLRRPCEDSWVIYGWFETEAEAKDAGVGLVLTVSYCEWRVVREP